MFNAFNAYDLVKFVADELTFVVCYYFVREAPCFKQLSEPMYDHRRQNIRNWTYFRPFRMHVLGDKQIASVRVSSM